MVLPQFQTLYGYFPQIIRLMPRQFSSHEFINRIFQTAQSDFIEALYLFRNRRAPMREVTRQLSKRLHDYPSLVRCIGRQVPNRDIFGDPSRCARWEKI